MPHHYSSRMHDTILLNAVAEALGGTPDVPQALSRVLALVARSLGLRTGWVWLLDPKTDQFFNVAALHLPPSLQEPVRMTGVPCWCLQAFRAGTLTPRTIDVLACSRLHEAVQAGGADGTEGLICHASIPLFSQSEPLGVMNIAAPSGRALSPAELALLAAVGTQVSLAVERDRQAAERAGLVRAEERTRLAREIHDTLAQDLTAIALHIEAALPHLQSDPERARERLGRALNLSHNALEEARRSVLDLRAVPLMGDPLAAALSVLARAVTSETGIRVHVRASEEQTLPLRVEAELFRIAQEALTNVRRHAHATEVLMVLNVTEDVARLAVRDDGCGFRSRGIVNGCHGIMGMRERAKRLGGRLRIVRRIGGGTVVQATVPLAPEARA